MRDDGVDAMRSLAQLILLTRVRGVADITRFLQLQRPGLQVVPIETREELLALSHDTFAGARLIGFGTDVIVPKTILDALGFGAYNFHPGPPSHPGWAPACFAIYDRVAVFGATAHLMVERVDEGPIVGTELFFLSPDMTPDALDRAALRAMLVLLRRLGPALVTPSEALPTLPIEWGKPKRRRADFAKMCAMTADLHGDEQARRIHAFTTNNPAYPVPQIPVARPINFQQDAVEVVNLLPYR